MKSIKSLVALAALAVAAVAFSAGSALANTAANTLITNSAKLTYTGGVPVTASVGVTVSLVPAAATVTISAGPSVAYVGPNSPKISDTITVISNTNGPADYDITPVIGATTNETGATVAAGGKVTVGATVTTAGSTANYLVVPAGLTGANTVNGISTGSNIFFTVNSHPYTITNVTVADQADGTFKISWAGQALPGADVPGVGTQVSEVKTFNVDVLPGTMLTAGVNITVSVSANVVTAGAGTATPQTAALNTWTTTNANPSVAFNKYVRNLTAAGNSTGTGATSLTVNAAQNTYYTGGVTGKPGDVLEYVIIATNNGTVDLAGSAISDFVPINFVNLVLSAYGTAGSGKDILYVDPSNSTNTLTTGTTGQAIVTGNSSNPNLIVNVGNGASSSTGGVIPAGKSVTIAYQTTIR